MFYMYYCIIREESLGRSCGKKGENHRKVKGEDMLLAYNLHKISMYHAIGVFYLRYEYKIALDGC